MSDLMCKCKKSSSLRRNHAIYRLKIFVKEIFFDRIRCNLSLRLSKIAGEITPSF